MCLSVWLSVCMNLCVCLCLCVCVCVCVLVRIPDDGKARVVQAGLDIQGHNPEIWTPVVAHRFGVLLQLLSDSTPRAH